ncbi:PIN domain-containing protein [Phytohabitans sp. ZYX-F-186]|uniref:Ribonuclease VapC n=1 Tax=Phytohabitans maris TaxID=3071409 RepID=A0ABU0ZTC7_9ACTN|nr:PIN domain-containing protein [Phytohabitans sp. ZYX-F-186]MDQ7910286.1 PIN domain-containing protein [Phytohabitans sp. ZYX-F-186]
MTFVVLDTDVASASFLGRLPDHLHAWLATREPCTTFVTLGELAKWTASRSRGPQRRAALATWRQHVTVLRYDERVATTWGTLQARAQLRGRPRPVDDTWIAACCLAEGLPLATLRAEDFAAFATYDGLQLVDMT